MSSYRSQQLLENYGLIQFINHDFLPDNTEIIEATDFEIIAQIMDQQIVWEYQRSHDHTVMALLETMRSLSREYHEWTDLMIADLSQLYLYNIRSEVPDDPHFMTDLVAELRQQMIRLQIAQPTVLNYIQMVIENFPSTTTLSSDGFAKDILNLLANDQSASDS